MQPNDYSNFSASIFYVAMYATMIYDMFPTCGTKCYVVSIFFFLVFVDSTATSFILFPLFSSMVHDLSEGGQCIITVE